MSHFTIFDTEVLHCSDQGKWQNANFGVKICTTLFTDTVTKISWSQRL